MAVSFISGHGCLTTKSFGLLGATVRQPAQLPALVVPKADQTRVLQLFVWKRVLHWGATEGSSPPMGSWYHATQLSLAELMWQCSLTQGMCLGWKRLRHPSAVLNEGGMVVDVAEVGSYNSDGFPLSSCDQGLGILSVWELVKCCPADRFMVLSTLTEVVNSHTRTMHCLCFLLTENRTLELILF